MSDASHGIQVFESHVAVRARPWMWVGPISSRLTANLLLREAFCCARDDARRGQCTLIEVELAQGGAATVRDNGPGLPLRRNARGQTIAETYFVDLTACSSAKPSEVSDTLCQAGLAVLNALSRTLRVQIFAEGSEWSQSFARGAPVTAMSRVGPSRRRGTEISFQLDDSILPQTQFDFEELVNWVPLSGDGATYAVTDSRTGRTATVLSPR
jgi:DNA gyrase/topoisomerase IV subunit B